MSQSGVNLAVTEDGAAYNKLRRPDDYLQSLTAQYPPKSELPPAKRKFEAVETSGHEEDQAPESKRSREEHAPKTGATPARALAGDTRRVYRPVKENGMQTMFPGLDDDSASDADDTTRDALAYLRSVRSEASTIPTLLVAPPQALKDHGRNRSMYDDGIGDHRAVYQDGTWVAVDVGADAGYYGEDDEWSQYEDDIDPQAAYYKALLGRYRALRVALAKADPRELAALIKADPKKYANVRLPYYKSDWRYAFDNKFPTPALVAQIDDKGLYRALEYVSEVLTTGTSISKQKSCWIWTLLALAGDSGTLDYFKVGRIRELGHRAGQLSIRLRSGERQDVYRDAAENDAEDWEVDSEGENGDDQDASEMGEETRAQEAVLASEDQQSLKDDQGDRREDGAKPLTEVRGRSSERETQAHPPRSVNNGHQDDMTSISEDEGEIQEDEPHSETAPDDVEAARARLLAQLGDNLVTESIPDRKIPAHQLKARQAHWEPLPGKRHRHNGRVCKDPSCQTNKGRQEAHRKAALRAAQGGKVTGSIPTIPSQFTQVPRPAANRERQEAGSEKSSVVTRVGVFLHDEPEPLSDSQGEKIIQQLPTKIATRDVDPHKGVEGVLDQQLVGADQATSCESDSEDENVREVDMNTRITIDMILTVVGDCYGQRDLLKFREAW